MSRNLGNAGGAPPAPAVRTARTGWRDPRLWIGILLLSVSVVAGARLMATADDTEPVWVISTTMGAGSPVGAEDVEVRRVRFADRGDLERYFPADTTLPADLVLGRTVGAGEMLPRSAVGAAQDTDLVQVPLEVEPHRVPPAVTTGAVVDVYVDDRGQRGGSDEGQALSGVTVVDSPDYQETFAVSGFRQIVVAVPAAEAAEFEALLAGLDDPVLRLHHE